MAQMSLDLKRCKADVVVENNGDLDHLNQQFSMVLSEIRRPLTWIEFWRSRQGAFSWADPKCKTDVRSRDGSTPPATEKLCHHCPQQKDRVKMVATESNLSVTCKEETRKLLSLVTKRAQNDIGMEHPGPSCHQERSSDRLNKRAHNLDPIRN
ncbi:P-loop containing nucleoside triphosphate hydrolase protein [Raphanus sativus]|nr:P-loop containing nucleoside triphosphate hydrolase protein [Raphanus sativus]